MQVVKCHTGEQAATQVPSPWALLEGLCHGGEQAATQTPSTWALLKGQLS